MDTAIKLKSKGIEILVSAVEEACETLESIQNDQKLADQIPLLKQIQNKLKLYDIDVSLMVETLVKGHNYGI